MNLYVDASSLAKLLVDEPGRTATVDLLAAATSHTSRLTEVELARMLVRRGIVHDGEELRQALETVRILDLDDSVLLGAARIPTPGLGTLDAIHLATALRVREELDGFVTHDAALAEAAGALGFTVLTPT